MGSQRLRVGLLANVVEIEVHRLLGRAKVERMTLGQEEAALADAAHGVGRMADEEEREAAVAHLPHAGDALLLEADVADREDLVHDQNVRIDRDCHREREPGEHPAGVRLHGLVDVLADVGEGRDLVEARRDLGGGDAEDRGGEEHVVAAGELRVEPAAELEQRGEPAPHVHLAFRRRHCPRDDLEQRGLPRAVAPDDPQALAAADLEGHVPQGPDRLEVLAAAAREGLLKAVLRSGVERVALADVLDADGDVRAVI